MLAYRGKQISMIFQDPMTSLNPVIPVRKQVAEVLKLHNEKSMTKKQIDQRVDEMFRLVGIPPERKYEYPHQFSGGMKQRVVIAISLACEPELLIADEPTTALDVETERLKPIDGMIADPSNLPAGCKFHPRCPYCTDKCRTDQPRPYNRNGLMICCHRFEKEGVE